MSNNQDKTKVTRISADDGVKSAKAASKPAVKAKKQSVRKKTDGSADSKRSFGVLGKISGYFKGAWFELRQVHWPTRRATWGLTGAVLIFSAFFVVLITLLDAGFKFVFEQILK